MGQLKQLAKQTALYGMSSILGRIINYFLVPLHTSFFKPEELGVVTNLYGYVGLIMIIITFGMETAFFRFASRLKGNQAYSVAATAIMIISTLMAVLIFLNAELVASFIPESGNSPYASQMVRWLAIIVLIDAITAIPFCKLRLDNRPLKFASAKLIAIFLNIGLQVFFLIIVPVIHNGEYLSSLSDFTSVIITQDFGIAFIFMANLIANALAATLLWKEFIAIRINLNWAVLKPMLIYGFPILIAGLAGWISSDLDKTVVALWASGGQEAQGVYGQTFKIGVLMVLAIQAFRYAAEPFFFSQSESKTAPKLFAKTLHYFVILGLILFVAVCTNINLIANIFLRSESYRVALFLVPVIMIGKLLNGVYINLSIWFKLKDKTHYGIVFAVVGGVVTLIANFILLPIMGYSGSAIAIVLSYLVMCFSCYFVGRRFMPIPYNFRPLLLYLIVACGLVSVVFIIPFENYFLEYAYGISAPLSFVIGAYLIERNKLRANVAVD